MVQLLQKFKMQPSGEPTKTELSEGLNSFAFKAMTLWFEIELILIPDERKSVYVDFCQISAV